MDRGWAVAGARVLVPVAGGAPAILSVDLGSGDPTPLAGSGPAWRRPRAMVVDPASNRAFVTDSDLRAVVAIDLASGDRSVVAGGAIGLGPAMSEPNSLALDLARGWIVVTDFSYDGVIVVDAETGDRALLSH